MVRIITTKEEVETFRDSWKELCRNSNNVTPFQTIDYVLSALQTVSQNKGNIHVVCYYRQKDNSLQAIFPWYVDKKKTLRFINDIHTDFCNGIVRKESIGDYHLWDDVSEHIKTDPNIRRVRFDNVMPNSYMLAYFGYFLKPAVIFCNNAYSVLSVDKRQSDQNFLYTIQLPNSTERNRLKKICNKMDDTEFEVYKLPSSYPKEILDNLMAQMVKSKIRIETYFSQIRNVVESLYAAGLLLVCVTKKNGQPLSANLFLKEELSNEYYNWLVFYVDKQYNLWNVLQSVEYISTEGGNLNFCRGTYEYKMRNFRPQLHNLYTLRWSKSLWGQIRDIADMSFYQLKQVVKKSIKDKMRIFAILHEPASYTIDRNKAVYDKLDTRYVFKNL